MGIAVTIIVAAFSLRAALVLQGADPWTGYFLTPMRLDALAVGAFWSAIRGPNGVSGLVRPAWIIGAVLCFGDIHPRRLHQERPPDQAGDAGRRLFDVGLGIWRVHCCWACVVPAGCVLEYRCAAVVWPL